MANQTASIGALALALSKAQAAILPAIKDKNNPFFKSKYADLSNIWDSIRKPLTDNELAVIQTTSMGEHFPTLVTTLVHSSGEWIQSYYPIRPTKDDPQGMGSAITYARRYALAAIAGASTEDDDGNEASAPAPKKAPPARPVTQQEAKALLLGERTEILDADAPPAKTYPATDWAQYPYRYHLPYKKEGVDMDEVRKWLKEKKFRFNPEDKHYYGHLFVERIKEYLRPLNPEPVVTPVEEDDVPFSFYEGDNGNTEVQE